VVSAVFEPMIPLRPWTAWTFCAQGASAVAHPEALKDAAWLSALVPGTVAASLAAAGRWNLSQPLDADDHDWWFRTTFPAPTNHPCHLCFDGLATLAEIWLNGQLLLTTDNMFRRYRLDVASHLQPENQLVLGFRSLTHGLQQKRPRPRWKTNLVAHQQLRWQRTTLLGRIPGWSPLVPPVGPWRDVRLETGPALITDLRLQSAVQGNVGTVTLQARIDAPKPPHCVALSVGPHSVLAQCRPDGRGVAIQATLRIPEPPLWWPHTHGPQPLFDCRLEIALGDANFAYSCGKIGFRTVEADQGRFALRVNGTPLYCRGACWTVCDIITLDGTPETLARDLRLAKDAGVNMLRVGGTMIYESDLFYSHCDELGILVWQDFMFANMDYPVDDPDFAAAIEAEAVDTLSRLAPHPCVAIYCGNSEVEQQAAMLGMPESVWRNSWFAERLPALCAERHSSAAYLRSTPSGGVLPFHVREGVAHYYGIGAYQRTPADLRKDDVAFTSECLGFANIPEQATLNLLGGDMPALHHPRWKERVPRDTGAGWDFDDVRDFYLHWLFGVDPVRLRSFDPDRYLQLSRVVPGEMMSQAFAEWRSARSRNSGGLVWFFKDLWPGAGWGILDSLGVPKAVYYALRRAWQPRQIALTDEGLEGLHVHIINETTEPFSGFVELVLMKDGHIIAARQEVGCRLEPRARQTLMADAVLQGFYDVAYAYRFGSPKHDVAIATLLDERRQTIGDAYYFPTRREPAFAPEQSLTAEAERQPDGSWQLSLHGERFLHHVAIDAKGFRADDNYFHLPPLRPKILRLTPTSANTGKLNGEVGAINLKRSTRISSRTIAEPPSTVGRTFDAAEPQRGASF
jgi:beta-mannosidase